MLTNKKERKIRINIGTRKFTIYEYQERNLRQPVGTGINQEIRKYSDIAFSGRRYQTNMNNDCSHDAGSKEIRKYINIRKVSKQVSNE